MRLFLKLKAVTTVRVGAPAPRGLAADITLYRTPNGKLAIPGASLKGVLRTIASALAPQLSLSSCGTVNPNNMKDCDVCVLFGKPGGLLTPIRVGIFTCVTEPVAVSVLPRLRISERSGRAEEGALFEVEVLPPETEFEGVVTVYPSLMPAPKRPAMLKLIMHSFRHLRVNRLGRGDSVFDVKLLNPDDVEKWLSSNGVPADESRRLVDQLRDWFWFRGGGP